MGNRPRAGAGGCGACRTGSPSCGQAMAVPDEGWLWGQLGTFAFVGATGLEA